jgi:hypothetical protein
MTDSLFVLWTSGDRDVAIETVFMYALNAKTHGWFDEVELCIWGPSATLAVEDEEINVRLTHMKRQGVKLTACKACTDHLDLTKDLEEMGVDVIYMGKPLTEKLKSDVKVLTF